MGDEINEDEQGHTYDRHRRLQSYCSAVRAREVAGTLNLWAEPDSPRSIFAVSADVGEPRIGLVVAEEGAGACSASARMLCGKRQIGRAGRSSRAVHL